MDYDNNFYDKLKEISDKINQIETIQKTDIMQIKASIGSLTRYIADTQETVNFSEIQSHLDSLSYKIETCNNIVAKDLSSDISILKSTVRDLENMQRDNLKSSEFEDFRKQHLNITVKNNESLLAYVKNIKNSFENIANHLSGLQNKQKEVLTGEEFDKAQRKIEENRVRSNEIVLKELDYIKSAAESIKDCMKYTVKEDAFSSIKNDLNDVKYAIGEIKKNDNARVNSDELRNLQSEIVSVKSALDYIKSKQDTSFTSSEADLLGKELSEVKASIANIQNLRDSIFTKDEYSRINEEFSAVKSAINDIKEDALKAVNKSDLDAVSNETAEIKSMLAELQNKAENNSSSNDNEYINEELSTIKKALNDIREKQSTLFPQAVFDGLRNDFDEVKENISNLASELNNQTTSFRQEAFDGLKNDFDTVKDNITNIITELNSVKNAAYALKTDNDEVTSVLRNKLEEIQSSIKDNLDQITSKINEVPSISEIGAVVSDINGFHKEDIKQTAEKLQELQNSLSAFESEFRNNDFGTKFGQINDIYTSINKINDWIDKVGYINQSLENVYARFGETADFDEISNKVDIIYDNMTLFNSGMKQLDEISSLTSEITKKMPEIVSVKQTSEEALAAVTSVKNKIGELFAAEPDFEDIGNKIDIIYENLFMLTEKTAKVDEINSVVCDIKNKTAAFENYKNETSGLLSTVSDIKNKLDTVFENPEQIDDVTNKIDILYDNLTALNLREAKTDEIAEEINDIKNDLEQINSEDLAGKLKEIVITANGLAKADDLQNIHEALALIAKKLDNNSTLDDAENLLEKLGEISNKSDLITGEMFDGGFVDKINALSEKINAINDNIDDELVFSKIDLIYENISLLNTWVNKLDDLSEKNDIINRRFNSKMEEINGELSKLTSNIPTMKENLDLISEELNKSLDENQKQTGDEIKSLKESFADITEDISSISVRTNKLILSADDANKEFEKCLVTFKNALNDFETQNKSINPGEKFDILQAKIAGIYELMKKNANSSQNLNNAFTYLGNWADNAGAMITSSAEGISEIKETQSNQTEKIAEELKKLSSDLASFESEISASIQNVTGCLKSVSGISDAVKITLKQNQLCLNEIAGIKDTVAKLTETVDNSAKKDSKNNAELLETMQDKLALLEDGFSSFKNDDVSEIKSLMTGVTVQLGTSLRPDIDTLNNKIEQISEAEESKFGAFENLVQEKIAKQEKQIHSLEEKLDALTAKIDKLSDSVSETSQDNQIKDVLNYIATQLAATNENSAMIKDVAEKVTTFDSGINKIVSYLEEDE